MGSGVIVTADGYILTNNHVVSEADEIRVRTLENRTLVAKVIGTDPQTDVAVIKIDAKDLKPIVQGNSDKLRVGEIVLAIGSPMSANLAHTVTQGIVSAKGRSNVGLAEYEDFIQTDAGINPGNSGGALVNLDGELVGINTAIASRSGGSEGIGFAVPINMAHSVMEALMTKGEVVRSWLGVQAQDMTDELARAMSIKPQDGVLIAGVQDSSPAKKAGLQAGDVIYQIDGDKIESAAQLRNKIAVMSPRTKIRLSFLRDAKPKSLELVLEKLPSPEAIATVSAKEAQEVSNLLGFQVANLSQQLIQRYRLDRNSKGVVIVGINPDSNAASAGIREGDLVQALNKKPISGLDDFMAQTKTLKESQTILLKLARQGANLFIAFNLNS